MLESFNHIPQQKPPYIAKSYPLYNADFPLRSTDKKMEFCNSSIAIINTLTLGWPDTGDFPIVADRIRLYKKFHVAWKVSVGTVHSQNTRSSTRRDDSYLWWWHQRVDRQGRPVGPKYRRFGQAIVFAMAYTWEHLVVVRAWAEGDVIVDQELSTVSVKGELGGMETVKINAIGGMVGRIIYDGNGGKMTMLVEDLEGVAVEC